MKALKFGTFYITLPAEKYLKMNLRANKSINKRKQNINKAKLLQLKLIHVFARAILLMKKLEIQKLSPLLLHQK